MRKGRLRTRSKIRGWGGVGMMGGCGGVLAVLFGLGGMNCAYRLGNWGERRIGGVWAT